MSTKERCPVCLREFKSGDMSATDIELGTCHAECLEGCPVVDLETGQPSEWPITTYPYDEISDDPINLAGSGPVPIEARED